MAPGTLNYPQKLLSHIKLDHSLCAFDGGMGVVWGWFWFIFYSFSPSSPFFQNAYFCSEVWCFVFFFNTWHFLLSLLRVTLRQSFFICVYVNRLIYLLTYGLYVFSIIKSFYFFFPLWILKLALKWCNFITSW